MGFGANIAKKRVSRPNSVYSKSCISGSEGRWTLGFCMEAIKTLKPNYQHWFRVGSTAKSFLTLRPLQHTKSRKCRQNANIGTYIPMGHRSPYDMTYTENEGPIVSVYKHTYLRVLPLIQSQSCMHMGTCAKGRFGGRAHKAILYKKADRLGRIKQAIHGDLCAL